MSRRAAISASSHPAKDPAAAGPPAAAGEVDALKTKILALVSHELRTPLTSIIGYAEILLEELPGPLNEEQRRYVATVMSKGEQLLGMITGIIEVSRIAAGGLRVASEPLAVSEALERAAAVVTPRVAHRRVQVVLPNPSSHLVRADRDILSQVLVHLLDNAVKFTPDGGAVTVSVEAAPLAGEAAAPPAQQPGVHIAIADTGIGIARDHQARIFEPFFQVDSSPTRRYGGSGLGLTLAKSYVEAQGGCIRVESDVDVGSTFTVSLPAASEDLARHPSGNLHGLDHSG